MRLLSKCIMFLCSISILSTQHCMAGRGGFPETSFYSQASQDQFVYSLLYELSDKQDEGYYLEIGAGHPLIINNSYFFEKNLGWKGVSIDINPEIRKEWEPMRVNPLVIEDACQIDYAALLKDFPYVIDYLSLDIDDAYDVVLKRIPFDEHVFKVITIEHDFYRFGDKYRRVEREILASLGYRLICPSISNQCNEYEDWWIYPDAFSADLLSKLASLDLSGKSHEEIIPILQGAFE